MPGSIGWVVPFPLRGSGGHRTIYQNVCALSATGFSCHVYLEGTRARDAQRGAQLAEQWFGPIQASFHSVDELGRRAHDVVFATAWSTADAVRALRSDAAKAYFVQDDEPRFLPVGDDYMRARNTYRYGFEGITIGRWLARHLHSGFGMRTRHFDFCADLERYYPERSQTRAGVCFVHQPDKPRRCTRIGLEALAIVTRERPDVEIVTFGSEAAPQLPFAVRHAGLLSVAECNALYNTCAVGLCISATNPSRIPFEMMAAGLPVVEIWADNTVWDFPDTAMRLAEPSPESIAWSILEVLREDATRHAMSSAGHAFMQRRGLDVGFAQFVSCVEDLVEHRTLQSQEPPPALYREGELRVPADARASLRRHASGLATGTSVRRSVVGRVGRRLWLASRMLIAGR